MMSMECGRTYDLPARGVRSGQAAVLEGLQLSSAERLFPPVGRTPS